jgi:hypothetical protein
MTNLMQTVEECFVEDEWKFDPDREARVIRTGVQATNGSYRIFVQIFDELQIVIVYVLSPNNVPEEYRLAVGRYLHLANYGLKIGNFEFDETDGEVRYKSSIDVEGGALTTDMVRNLIGASVSTMDRYYKGMMSIVYGGSSPEGSIAQVESPTGSTD